MRDRVPVAIGGGLNLADADAALGPGEARRVRNLVLDGLGRLQPRRAASAFGTPSGDVVGMFRFPFHAEAQDPIGALAVLYSGTTASLVRVGTDGQVFGTAVASWTSLTERPVMSAAVLGQKLFVGGRAAGNLTLRYFDAATDAVVTPSFVFGEGDPGAATPRVLAQYNNMIFAAGFGTEDDPDRPEIVRFTYLGLDSFGHVAAGDAGVNSESEHIFDREDAIGIGERGAPVLAMGPAMGRLLILSDRGLHHLFGYDRDSFQAEHLDGLRGCVATRAFGTAAGTAFWWSPVGPCVYTGQAAEDFGRKVRPRFPDIDPTTLVFFHSREHHEARWYYWDGATSPYIGWNYERREWTEGLTPFRVFCTGLVSKTSTDVSSGVENIPAGPSGAPTGFTVDSTTTNTAAVSFTTGDADAETEVLLEGALVTTLDPGDEDVVLTGLNPDTTYSVSLRHKKNGQLSSSLTDDVTTDEEGGTLAPPTSPTVEEEGGRLATSWVLGQGNVKTEVWRRDDAGGDSELVHTSATDATSWLDPAPCMASPPPNPAPCPSGTWHYKFRHRDASASSVVSAFTAEVEGVL